MASLWSSVKGLIWQDLKAPPLSLAEEPSPALTGPGADLALLRDVNGVVGSIAISSEGRAFAFDLPRLFDAGAVQRLATRLVQVHAALTSDGSEFSSARMVFEAHELHIEPLQRGLLGVLTRGTNDSPALRLALKLVARRISARFEVGDTSG